MAKKKQLYVVANAHLDSQWNWTIQDTIRDCVKNTLDDNFVLMDKYPAYKMNFEGAFRYALAKEYYPDKFEKLKKYVASGQWCVSGSTWDAMDANVPSSEALMRQVLLGNGFFEKEFGKRSNDIFLADCFGFRYALPSIAAHMGLNGFSTQKLVWGAGAPIVNADGTVSRPMPGDFDRLDLGKWYGPDGNYVIGSFLEGNYTYNFNQREDTRPVNAREEYLADIERNERLSGVSKHSMYYGTGDYGGSCDPKSAEMVQEAIDHQGEGLYEVVSASTGQIMQELTKEELDNLPSYDGMLLIPHGYGAMTSRTINKRWNRKSELLADSCERACVIAALCGAMEYPRSRLDFAWKQFLWHQFHDDVTGTSIAPAYVFSHNDYIIAQNIFASELTAAIKALARSLDTAVEGKPLLVYNPVAFENSELVRAFLPEGMGDDVRVFAPCGTELPAQVSEEDGRKVLTFSAKLPSLSLCVFDIREGKCEAASELSLDEEIKTFSNARYTVTLNDNGDIISVYDKKASRELLSGPSRFSIGPDHSSNWPSWEISFEDLKKENAYVTKVESLDFISGPACVGAKIVRSYGKSTFTQIIKLWNGAERIDVDCEVDWKERSSILRVEFPLSVSNKYADFDQGLGADRGDTTDYYPYFQRNMHQWMDLTADDGSYGVTILNDCKYGADKPDDHTLRIALIHTPDTDYMPISGQSWQDMGKNIFSYSIAGHEGAREATPAQAACFNSLPLAFTTDAHEGKDRAISFASTSDRDLTIRCVKFEENGDRVIVRVQETAGKAHNSASINFISDILSAVETNGFEEGDAPVAFDGKSLTFDIGRYGVKTFALTLAPIGIDGKPLTFARVALPFDTRITSHNFCPAEGELANGVSIPCEIYCETPLIGGVPFKLAPAHVNNALTCKGQTIALPAGAEKLYIFAASKNGDKQVDFDGQVIGVQDCFEDVGSWYSLIAGTQYVIKRDEIAWAYTHTHDADGDRPYKFAYLFKYALDVAGKKTITLPNDPDIVITAATAQIGKAAETSPACWLYDHVPANNAPYHKLNVTGMKGKGSYREGSEMMMTATLITSDGLFDHFEGDCIELTNDASALIKIGDHDCTLKAVRTPLGEDVLEKKPCKAHSFVNRGEVPERALNGRTHGKWCAAPDANGCYWLEVDAGEEYEVGSWLVVHAGVEEAPSWNTVDFRLEAKVNEDDEWQVVDTVENNESYVTLRYFKAAKARYFRLFITKAASSDDDHCRIFAFRVYKS